MIPSITYTDVVLHHYNYDLKKPWFLYFEITNNLTGTKLRRQIRGGMHYLKTKDLRLRAAADLKKHWQDKLANGWHPFENVGFSLVYPVTPFNDAVDFAFSKCNISSKSISDYRGTATYIKEAAAKLGFSKKPIKDFEQQHILIMMDYVQKMRKWSNDAYNKNLGYLSAILGRLKKYKAIKFNPCEDIGLLPVTEKEMYVPLTESEKKLLREHLYIHQYRFFVYLMVIYHTGIRPKEILSLKIKDIDLSEGLIKILPDFKAENSKTKRIRKVPINNHLLPFFRELQLHLYDRECYVFGSPFESGKGNKGSTTNGRGATHPDYFKPSYTAIKRDTVTRLWQRVVKKKLGIDKHQYALKHTGADDKIMADIPLDALKELYGHSSKLMTEKYARKVKEVYRKQLVECSPDF